MRGISRFSSRCFASFLRGKPPLDICLTYLAQDPGPWLIAIPSLSRSIALADLPPEVVVVDLDSNSVICAHPHPGALSTGSAREKARRRLEAAIGTVGAYFSVPVEITEAFPAGRFRPFSDVRLRCPLSLEHELIVILLQVEVGGIPKEAEKIRASPSWDVSVVSSQPHCPFADRSSSFPVGSSACYQRVRRHPR